MVIRRFWLNKIENALNLRSILWLTGVRRSGKTSILNQLTDSVYLDCELPEVRRRLEEPTGFLKGLRTPVLILDEVHRLSDPSNILKIAADYFKQIKVIATGSSTLGASKKFCDSLTGRKTELWLTPVLSAEVKDFGTLTFDERMNRGGLPEFLINKGLAGREIQEWVDSFWAKDIQEMFLIEKRTSFLRFMELLFVNSGEVFEATKYAGLCEISRTTILNYLSILEVSHIAHVIRPFFRSATTEITKAPRVYAFDTGFVSFFGLLNVERPEDRGLLWEHLVLNELHGTLQTKAIRYWRSKQKHEIDFVLPVRGKKGGCVTIEVKLSDRAFSARNLLYFRKLHPIGKNYVVCLNLNDSYETEVEGQRIQFVSLGKLTEELLKEKTSFHY